MSDLIKRDDALHIVDVARDEHPYKVPGLFVTYSEYNQGWSDAVDFIMSRMEKADPVPAAPRWVRCEERLPDVAEKVVAFAEGQIITAWRTFFSEPIGKWDTNDAVFVDNITHWMPLPEPPKEGE